MINEAMAIGSACACRWDEDQDPPQQTHICRFHETQLLEIKRLRAALVDARDALYNGFEPNNQSKAYKRAIAALDYEGGVELV